MPVLEGKRMSIMLAPLKAAPRKESKDERRAKEKAPKEAEKTGDAAETPKAEAAEADDK